MKMKAFKAALPYTIPICIGFLFLGMSYGFLMKSKGFSFVYPMSVSYTHLDGYKRQVRGVPGNTSALHHGPVGVAYETGEQRAVPLHP